MLRLGVLVALAASACYRPSIEPCALACNNGACPEGLHCNAQGLCASGPNAACDATPDADPGIDSGPNTVTIDVISEAGAPLADVPVIFGSASGELLADVRTNAIGRASAQVPPGGTVTVIRGNATNIGVTTHLDVWPNANIVSQFTRALGSHSVTVNWQSPMSGTFFDIYASCGQAILGSNVATAGLNLENECTTFDVIVVAALPPPNDPLFISSGGHPASTTLVDLTGATWRPTGPSFAATLANVPNDASITTELSVGGFVTPGLANATTPYVRSPVPLAGGVAFSNLPTMLGTRATIEIRTIVNGMQLLQRHVERLPPNTTSVQRDVAALRLPAFAPATTNLLARRIEWLVHGPPITPQLPNIAMARIAYNRGPISIDWHVIAPAAHIARIANGSTVEGWFSLPDVPGEHTFEIQGGEQNVREDVSIVRVPADTVNRVRGVLESNLASLDLFDVAGVSSVSTSTAD